MQDDFDSCQKRSCIFMECLYKEKEIHKNHRFSLIQRKLFLISALFGVGSLQSLNSGHDIDPSWLIYLVPFVAIAYDIFILAEDFKVKRVGAFLLMDRSRICRDEEYWEDFVNANREQLAAYATFLLTFLSSFAALILILKRLLSGFEWASFLILIAIIVFYFSYYKYFYMKSIESNKRLESFISSTQTQSSARP
jgi:hypothetical protein